MTSDVRSSTLRERMSRARTPFGAVPISTIYGYDYPLSSGINQKTISQKHENLSDCVDYMVRSTRAFSENRALDPYYTSPATASLSFMPMALRAARTPSPFREESPYDRDLFRSVTPYRVSYREDSPYERESYRSVPPPPVRSVRPEPEVHIRRAPVLDTPKRNTSVSFNSTTPWNATGFYYSPRYPQSHRGTASTYNAIGRRYFDDLDYFCPYPSFRYDYFRYPVRRFVPSYVPFRYSRRY